MSIASELNNYRNGLDDAYGAVNDMSGIIPQHKNMDNLDQAIRTIPQSSGPTPGDGTLTIQKNGSTVATFTADQSTNTTANITVNDGKAVYMNQDSNDPDHILLYNDFAMTDQITDIYNDVYLKILNGEHIVFIDKVNGYGTPLGYPETYMYYGSSSFPDDEAYITLYGVKYDSSTHQLHPNEFSTAVLIVYTYQSPDYAVIAPGTEYQGKLTAGSNITISNGTISADTIYATTVAPASQVAPITTSQIQDGAVTAAKIDFTSLIAGAASFTAISAGADQNVTVNIPTQANTNYLVFLTIADHTAYWTELIYRPGGKTTTSFQITAMNKGNGSTGAFNINYLVIPQ